MILTCTYTYTCSLYDFLSYNVSKADMSNKTLVHADHTKNNNAHILKRWVLCDQLGLLWLQPLIGNEGIDYGKWIKIPGIVRLQKRK